MSENTTNKKIERKPNIKTGIAERVNVYHKIVGVKNFKEFIKKHGDLTHGLGNVWRYFLIKHFKEVVKKKSFGFTKSKMEKS